MPSPLPEALRARFQRYVVAIALLDRQLHHAVVVQFEGVSYRLCSRADLISEHVRVNAPTTPPPKRCELPPKTNNGAANRYSG